MNCGGNGGVLTHAIRAANTPTHVSLATSHPIVRTSGQSITIYGVRLRSGGGHFIPATYGSLAVAISNPMHVLKIKGKSPTCRTARHPTSTSTHACRMGTFGKLTRILLRDANRTKRTALAIISRGLPRASYILGLRGWTTCRLCRPTGQEPFSYL